MSNQYIEEKVGKKLHGLLNQTVTRELTVMEYERVVDLIECLLSDTYTKAKLEVLEELARGMNGRKMKIHDTWQSTHDRDDDRFDPEDLAFNQGIDSGLSEIVEMRKLLN